MTKRISPDSIAHELGIAAEVFDTDLVDPRIAEYEESCRLAAIADGEAIEYNGITYKTFFLYR